MFELWLPISDIATEGRAFTFDDQAFWKKGWNEFKLKLRPAKDLVAEYTILPQSDNGALVQGSLKGSVSMACDRCTGLFEYDIDVTFDTYEQLPEEGDDEEPRIREENGQLQLNIGAILWEEFALTLPFKPLCSEGCKGICAGCGKDLNTQKCECEQEEGDERLAVFRNLKIK
ncbi:YceD family protein [Pseudodesulfovibrio sediminis]|uniref:DUF177 domain-containing protein n=1 Tax=Pseudodesulfovibrio sediminis TaxID=2810563 RepID=A0ABN6ET56_9BACT|nr:DUF177 domain-containing protein [Pseudodesulfovibrio sediminis]BCS88370.1 hypothetical protein PSDVSF_16120 [Pseudodesulfovibrio sediminis]